MNIQIVAANQAYREHFAEGDRVCGKHCYEISHHYRVPCDQLGESCPLAGARASGTRCPALHVHHTAEGEEHESVTVHPLYDNRGRISFYLEVLAQQQIASLKSSRNGQMVGRSPAFAGMLDLVTRVADTPTTVLLLGESGTGKDLVSRAVHSLSSRSSGPFVPLDCSGLTETLFESELFGHEKGSFTGAHERKRGLVEAANEGTLFLDEVGDIPLSLQVKLLRLLETGTFRRVGSVEQRRSDFRLVCATHRDLTKRVEAEQFREDLYYRISAFPIHLPTLRERSEDIPLLAACIFERLGCGGALPPDRRGPRGAAGPQLSQATFASSTTCWSAPACSATAASIRPRAPAPDRRRATAHPLGMPDAHPPSHVDHDPLHSTTSRPATSSGSAVASSARAPSWPTGWASRSAPSTGGCASTRPRPPKASYVTKLPITTTGRPRGRPVVPSRCAVPTLLVADG